MPRPKFKPIKRLSLLECFESLTESFNKTILTDFTIIDFGTYSACRFSTNSGNVYDLEFHSTIENTKTVLNDGETLQKKLNTKNNLINTIDVGFTLANVINKENPEEYELETNLNEQFELMGRITYILKQTVKKHKVKLIVIGDSQRNKPEIYKKIFENHFSDDYALFYGESNNHDGKNSLFIIRKT